MSTLAPATTDGVRPTRPGELERFLVGEPEARPTVEELHAAMLAGYAYVRSPDHPQRAALRYAYLAGSTRHLAVKRELARLLRAWDAAGVSALAFKGFHLAEFVYASPGQRPYADVDLLIDERRVDTACREAEALGWEVLWHLGGHDHPLAPRGPGYRGHEAAQIRLSAIDLLIDVHRRVAHNNHNRLGGNEVQARLTDAAWEAATTVEWEGARLALPSPADAIVFGLAINRCWGSDEWQVKPRDYADIEALIARTGVTPRDVVARARDLGVARTVELYLERCDPQRRRISLAAPSWLQVRRWNLSIARERGQRDLQHLLMEAEELATGVWEIASVLPSVRRAARLVRAGSPAADDAHARVSDSPGGAETGGAGTGGAETGGAGRGSAGRGRTAAELDSTGWRRTRRAIHRGIRLLGVPEASRDLVAARAAFEVLRRRGYAVSLEPARDPDGTPHLRLDGRLIALPPDAEAIAAPPD